jgi:hypothetical protein
LKNWPIEIYLIPILVLSVLLWVLAFEACQHLKGQVDESLFGVDERASDSDRDSGADFSPSDYRDSNR